MRERVRALIEDVRFEKGMTALIVANAITLGLETSPAVVARLGGVLQAIDRTVLGVFVVELLLRAFVHRRRFFHDSWRVFDLVVVGVALLPASGAFRVFRALRVLRVLRLGSLVAPVPGGVSALSPGLPWPGSLPPPPAGPPGSFRPTG